MSKLEQKQLDEMIDELISDGPEVKEPDEADVEPAVVEDVEEPVVDEDLPPVKSEDKVADEGEEDEAEPEPEPDDELMDLATRGLKKLIETEELAIQVEEGATDEDIRRAIRQAREARANDPAKTLEEMRAWMNEQAQSLFGKAPAQGEQQLQQPAAAAKELEVKPLAQTFEVSDEMYANALTDKASFAKVLNEAIAYGQQAQVQQIVPLMNKMVQQQLSINQMVNDFYSDNVDLKPYRQFVGFVANQVQSSHPDWDMPKIFQETEKIARDKLRLKRQMEQSSEEKPKAKKPAFVVSGKKPNARQRSSRISEEEKEMLELLKPDDFS